MFRRAVGAGSFGMIDYVFHVEGEHPRDLPLTDGDRSRVHAWLRALFEDQKPRALTIGSPPARISRGALRTTPSSPPDPGVATEAAGACWSIALAVAQEWAADLEAGRAGRYRAHPATRTSIVRDL